MICVAVMHPGGSEYETGSDTPHSVGELVGRETDELLELAEDEKFGKQQQESLKALVRHTL